MGRMDYLLQCLGTRTSRGQGVDDQWAHPPPSMWQCVELFSGSGNVSGCFRRAGKAVASFDRVWAVRPWTSPKSQDFCLGPKFKNWIIAI